MNHLSHTIRRFNGTAHNMGVRVTFDACLTSQTDRLHLHEPRSGVPMLGGNWAVMEIKVNVNPEAGQVA